MATALLQSETISFDQNISTVINDLKKNWKRAAVNSIHKEIIKTIDCKEKQGWPSRQGKYCFVFFVVVLCVLVFLVI